MDHIRSCSASSSSDRVKNIDTPLSSFFYNHHFPLIFQFSIQFWRDCALITCKYSFEMYCNGAVGLRFVSPESSRVRSSWRSNLFATRFLPFYNIFIFFFYKKSFKESRNPRNRLKNSDATLLAEIKRQALRLYYPLFHLFLVDKIPFSSSLYSPKYPLLFSPSPIPSISPFKSSPSPSWIRHFCITLHLC